jgi:predicted deacylase
LLDDLPGAPLRIPYWELVGDRPGARLTVLAGIHGAEYTSMAAVRRFGASLDPARMIGTVVAVPIVNLPAFWARSAFVVPVDGKNLNREFPGDPGGSYTAVLARHVHETFIVGSDFLVDCHAGDIPEALEPFCLYDQSPVEARSRELAVAYGLGHVVRQPSRTRTVAGSTSAAAADLGIPAITAEVGQNGLLDAAAVDRHVRGLENVARLLGIVPGEPAVMPAPVEHDGWEWVRTPVAGWWESLITVGQQVSAGESLGSVTDLDSGAVTVIRASATGVPLFRTTSPAVPADGLLLGLALGGR